MLMLASPLCAEENPAAGSLHTVRGAATVTRQGSVIPAEKGLKIYPQDIIATGKDGAVSIILQDNTTFSIGPDSQINLNEYIFSPALGNFSLIARLIKGTFIYLSGIMSKLSPESIKLETPVGTIAVRGTRFAAKVTAE
jgi:hypothetical protein